MAFEGFAREEQFSTHQINIDIASVINNDLAEVNRQSKYMAKNAALQEEWRDSYLTALNQKYALETQNRRDNYEFFMKNREDIHKQHQRNREVELKDAAKNRHVPSLGSILGPALLKMAASVGSAAINKEFADERKRIADEKGQAVKAAGGLYGIGSEAQQKFVEKGGFGEAYQKMSILKQAETRKYFNSLGDFKASEINVAAVHRINRLTEHDRQLAEHSRENSANRINDLFSELTINENGREISLFDLPNENIKTFINWFDKAEKIYIESVSGENGLSSEAQLNIRHALKQIQGQHRSRNYTQQYRNALEATTQQAYHAMDRLDAPGRAGFLFTPEGPEGRSLYSQITGKGPAGAWEFAAEYYKHQSADDITKFYNTPTFQGRSLAQDPKSHRSRIFQGLIRDAHDREHKSYQNLQTSMDNHGRGIIQQIKDNKIPEDTLRNWLHNSQFINQGGYSSKVGINPILGQVSSGVATEINSTILKALGIDPDTQSVSTEKPKVSQAFTRVTDKQRIVEAAVMGNMKPGDAIGVKLVEEKLDSEYQLKTLSVFDSWANEIRLRDDPNDEWTGEQLRMHLVAKVNNEKDPDWNNLKHWLTPVITEEQNGTKTVSFPGVDKYIENNQPKASGMSQAQVLIANKSAPEARAAVTKDKTILEHLRPWMGKLSAAQKAGEDLGPILDQMPKVLRYLGSRTPNGDGTQWVNYFIEDHFTDMKPLSGDDLFTREEAAKANSQITGYTKMLKAQQDFMLNSVQPYNPNHNYLTQHQQIARNQTPASGSVGSSGLNADFRSLGALTHYHPGNDIDGNHGGPNSHGDWLFKDTATAHYVFDYVTQQEVDGKKIILTEMGGRTSVGPGHAPNGGHYDKLKFDVPWDQFGSGPITSEDERKYNEVVGHIYDALKYKQQGIPVQQAIGGQQTQGAKEAHKLSHSGKEVSVQELVNFAFQAEQIGDLRARDYWMNLAAETRKKKIGGN